MESEKRNTTKWKTIVELIAINHNGHSFQLRHDSDFTSFKIHHSYRMDYIFCLTCHKRLEDSEKLQDKAKW